MAISTPTIAVETGSTSNATSYATATFNPVANALIVVKASVTDADDPGTMNITDDFADANTWTELANQPWNTIATPLCRTKIWWTIVGPAPGTVKTITVSGMPDACTGANIIAVSVASGFDTTTPIVQAPVSVDDSTGTSQTHTFAAFTGSTNLAISFVNALLATSGTLAVDAGWTGLGAEIGYATPTARAHVAYQLNASDTTAVWSWTTSGQSIGIGVEVAVAPSGPAIEVSVATDLMAQGGWYVVEFDADNGENEAFWGGTIADSQTTLDCWPAFLVGPPAPDEAQAAQDYRETYLHDDEAEDAWQAAVYGFPDLNSDYLGVLFPGITAEPIETFAAQPTFSEHDFATQVPTETEDYHQPPEQLEAFAPPEAVVPELLAAQPHFGEAFWPDSESEDYAAETTLDVASFLGISAAAEPVETFAAQPHYGEAFWPDAESEDFANESALDATWFAVPEALLEVFTAQPDHSGWVWEPEETADYASESVLDVDAFLSTQAPPEPIETFAAQPHYGDIQIEAIETEDYTPSLDIEAPFSVSTIPDEELIAAQFADSTIAAEDEPITDEASTSLDVAAFLSITVASPPLLVQAAQYGLLETQLEAFYTPDEMPYGLEPLDPVSLFMGVPHLLDDYSTGLLQLKWRYGAPKGSWTTGEPGAKWKLGVPGLRWIAGEPRAKWRASLKQPRR